MNSTVDDRIFFIPGRIGVASYVRFTSGVREMAIKRFLLYSAVCSFFIFLLLNPYQTLLFADDH